MTYGLGGYADQLSIDDYNKALSAGGSDYQMQQSAAPIPTAGGDMSGSGYAAQSETPDMSGNAYALAPPSPNQAYEPPPQQKKGGGIIGKLLPMVGGIIGGPVGAAVGGAIGNKDQDAVGKTTSIVGGLLGG